MSFSSSVLDYVLKRIRMEGLQNSLEDALKNINAIAGDVRLSKGIISVYSPSKIALIESCRLTS